ncbi:60S ribosomal protein L28-1 [Glycine soja]|uniref:60S ribosomal protein L28-1 n=1 Tax=Glycine soja TaxID=3848 RepID=A0A445FV02_GLYSO|nr:60S ribosomal protein L28-1 [Glycine soja]
MEPFEPCKSLSLHEKGTRDRCWWEGVWVRLKYCSAWKIQSRGLDPSNEDKVVDNYYRPDLKKAALARLSAVNKSLRVAKSGVKKRNRQAVKWIDFDGDPTSKPKDTLCDIGAPMIRSKTKRMKQALQGLIMEIKSPQGVVFYVQGHAWRHYHWRLRGGDETWHVATATGDTGTGIGASRRLHGSAGLTSDFNFAELQGGCRHPW